MKLDEQVSQNFKARELLHSDERPDLIKDITEIPENIGRNLRSLVVIAVQPIRNKFGATKILSGWRPHDLNVAIGGAEDSDHEYGMAADIVPAIGDLKKVFEWIKNNIPYRQVIYYPNKKFIHVSINTKDKPIKHEAFTK